MHDTDETIDIDDFTTIRRDFANYETGYALSDLNGNGFVDIDDLLILKANFLRYISSISPFDED